MTDTPTGYAAPEQPHVVLPNQDGLTPAQRMRRQILESADIGQEIVELPEWGLTVLVKGMAAGRRNDIAMASRVGNKTNPNLFYALVMIECTYDPESGERIFAPDDRVAILGKSGGPVDRVATTALRLSGLETESKKDEDEATDEDVLQASIEAAGKAFYSTPNGAPIS